MNRKIPKSNTSGSSGVYWSKTRGDWVIDVRSKEKRKQGRAATFEEASARRIEFARELHGEFARV
jgi:hypothetical protein